MSFEEWWELEYASHQLPDMAKFFALVGWYAARNAPEEGMQLVGAHGSLMDKLGDET